MRYKPRVPQSMEYLKNKPKKLNWKVIAGNPDELSDLQQYDLIYDSIDYSIRFPKQPEAA